MVRLKQQTERPRPHNDVYTGLLAVSLLGMLIACGLLFLDYRQYDQTRPVPVSISEIAGKR